MSAGIHEELIANLFKEIYSLCLNGDPISHSICNNLVSSLTLFLYSMLPKEEIQKQDKTSSLIRDILVYISEHYTEQLTLKTLSDVFHVSQGHISHTFTREFGISPINYAIDLRICDAKLMLINSTDSLVSIAERVGYHNTTHFTNIFTKRVNCSPTEYREYHSNKNYRTPTVEKNNNITTTINNSKEINQLKNDFAKIKEENEILQKAMAILAANN